MRFHTVAALYVLVFARFFAFSKENYISLLLIIGAVISAEMFNTAIEKLCDKISPEFHPLIKVVKDTAAGAVLILAIIAVIIAIILFGNIKGLSCMYNFYRNHPGNFILLILSFMINFIYIFKLPDFLKDKGEKKK